MLFRDAPVLRRSRFSAAARRFGIWRTVNVFMTVSLSISCSHYEPLPPSAPDCVGRAQNPRSASRRDGLQHQLDINIRM